MDRFDLQVSASNLEELFVTWLDELLYLYETERLICRRFVIDDISSRDMGDSPHNGKKLCATVFGEKVDPARHEIKTEIKSVTYHQLRVEKTDNVWRVQVIFDV
jgi:SHS2 domain-containing protein